MNIGFSINKKIVLMSWSFGTLLRDLQFKIIFFKGFLLKELYNIEYVKCPAQNWNYLNIYLLIIFLSFYSYQ